MVGAGVGAPGCAAATPPDPPIESTASSQYIWLICSGHCWVVYRNNVTVLPVAVALTVICCQLSCGCALADQTTSASNGFVPPFGSMPMRVKAFESGDEVHLIAPVGILQVRRNAH